jgi:hypothetical protein
LNKDRRRDERRRIKRIEMRRGKYGYSKTRNCFALHHGAVGKKRRRKQYSIGRLSGGGNLGSETLERRES